MLLQSVTHERSIERERLTADVAALRAENGRLASEAGALRVQLAAAEQSGAAGPAAATVAQQLRLAEQVRCGTSHTQCLECLRDISHKILPRDLTVSHRRF